MDVTKVRPCENVLLIERLGSWEEVNHEEGGLIVVEDRPQLEVGVVLAAGPGKNQGEVPMQVRQGDRVVFGRYAGTEYDRTHLFLREEEVHAILEVS